MPDGELQRAGAAGDARLDPPRGQPSVTIVFTDDELDLVAAYAAVAHREAGGVGLFAGVVRDHHLGESVAGLEYEAWDEPARAALRTVADGVLADFTGVRAVHLAHRLGPLEVGEVSVIVAASAPHRGEAIAATEALIDRLKDGVPIWKKEFLTDGDTRWPGTDTAV